MHIFMSSIFLRLMTHYYVDRVQIYLKKVAKIGDITFL